LEHLAIPKSGRAACTYKLAGPLHIYAFVTAVHEPPDVARFVAESVPSCERCAAIRRVWLADDDVQDLLMEHGLTPG